MVNEAVSSQPFASTTNTSYEPAQTETEEGPVIVAGVQSYVYGPVPPVGATPIVPSHVPLQVASVLNGLRSSSAGSAIVTSKES